MTSLSEDLRKALMDVAEVMRLAHSKGLINVLGGNASIRWGDGFWITPSQIPKNKLDVTDFVYVDINEGPKPNVKGRKPSIEWRMHREIYAALSDVNAILHTHSPYTIALYSLGLSVRPSEFVEAFSFSGCVSVVPKLPAGSSELASAVTEALVKCRIAVLLGHGVVVTASDIFRALDIAESLENMAKIELFRNMLRRF